MISQKRQNCSQTRLLAVDEESAVSEENAIA